MPDVFPTEPVRPAGSCPGGSGFHRPVLPVIGLLVLLVPGCNRDLPPGNEDHRREIRTWQQERQERLRSETGWLTLVGLHWLSEGENRFGTDRTNDIVLPEGTAPAIAGRFLLRGGEIRVDAPAGVGLTLEEGPVPDRPLRTDHHEDGPDILRLGDLCLHVIERGKRFAIRVRDPNSKTRTEFRGMEYYPINPDYRIRTKLVPYDPPHEIPVPNVLGNPEIQLAPGRVEFPVRGEMVSLTPVVGDPDDRDLFFIFSDPTNGTETYGAGRFMYAELEEDGSVTVDFNKAYTPPCAFTPYATCPLPLKENRLAVRIEAGEKFSGH